MGRDELQDPKPECAVQKTQRCQVLGLCVAEIFSDSDRAKCVYCKNKVDVEKGSAISKQ